jgi:SAM-dependent methyltransferase
MNSNGLGRKVVQSVLGLNVATLIRAVRRGPRDAASRAVAAYRVVEPLGVGPVRETPAPQPSDDFTNLFAIHGRLRARYGQRGETAKARGHRLRDGWFDRFAPEDRTGIDIGCQYDPINQTFRLWDHVFGDGDATLMEGVPDRVFHTVYASHVLEHIVDPVLALKNWYRLLMPGGHLIVMVPHRDMYEKKKILPSTWNPDHKWMWLPDRDEEPHTLSLANVIREAELENSEIVSLKILDEGYDYSLPADVHAVGEFSIEAIIKRKSD